MDAPSKRRILLWILVISLISGLITGLLPEGSSGERLWRIASSLFLSGVILRWFMLDARLHAYRLSGPTTLCLFALTGFAAPFYFFATRRWGFWKSLLKSALFFLLLSFVTGIGIVTMRHLVMGTWK